MGIKANIQLMSNASALGNGAAQTVPMGGGYAYMVAGTFGGTTVKMQILGPDGISWMDMGVSHVAAGYQRVDLPAGAQVRAVMTAGTPTLMYSSLGLVQGAD